MPPRPMLIFSFQSDMSGRAFLAEQVWYETLSRRADLVDEACPKNSDRRDACMCAYSGRVVFLGSRVRACVCVCVFLTSRGFPLCARVRVFSLVRAVFLGSRVRVCFPWFARFSWVRACVCVFLGSRDFPWFARACVCFPWFARFPLVRACVCVFALVRAVFLASRVRLCFPWFARFSLVRARVRACSRGFPCFARARVCACVFGGPRGACVFGGPRGFPRFSRRAPTFSLVFSLVLAVFSLVRARVCVSRAVFLVSRVRVCVRVFSGGRAVFFNFRAARQHFPFYPFKQILKLY